jgi:hypothetical protein
MSRNQFIKGIKEKYFGSKTAESWVDKGKDQAMKRHFDEAIHAYDQAIKLEPGLHP